MVAHIPHSTSLTLRLTEPVVFLLGGQDHERARARRRRAARSAAAANNPDGPGPGSRSTSPAGTGAAGERGRSREPVSRSAGFVHPGPTRSTSRSRVRGESPAHAGLRGTSRSQSRARGLGDLPEEGVAPPVLLTTGGGTEQEALEADEPPPALLRGLVTLTLSKPSRIRDIVVKFRGISRTDWPEGIGPRRLDTMEETVLTSTTVTFFDAASLTSDRRAASIGPGAFSPRPEAAGDRGRTSNRRAASMMPGLSTRDSQSPSGAAGQLSRIASSTDMAHHLQAPIEPSHPHQATTPPPVQPWELAPAYTTIAEPVPSVPSSPIVNAATSHERPLPPVPPHLDDLPSALERASIRSASPRSSVPSRFERSPTPSARSPLNPSSLTGSSTNLNLEIPPSPQRRSSDLIDLSESPPTTPDGDIESRRPSLRDHRLSDASGESVSSTSEGGAAGGAATGSGTTTTASSIRNGAGASQRSSFERGRPPATAANASNPASLLSGLGRTPSRSSNSSVPPPTTSAMKGRKSNGSAGGSNTRAGSKARFSLAGLGDRLRGKSTSRVRRDDSVGPGGSAMRSESPDARGGRSASIAGGGGRSQSRGRKGKQVVRDGEGGDNADESDDEETSKAKGWKEFRPGTYVYPISIPVPASLPPTISSDFGYVAYSLKATVHRAGALTANLSSTTDVVLVSTPGQDDTEESESIVVERFWETQMKYHVALSGKSFPVGGQIPISIRLSPMAKVKLYRVTAILEQKTSYYAHGRKLTRHEPPKKFPLMRIEHKDPKEPLLPILSDDPDAIKNHPLAEFFINPTSSDDSTPSCLDPLGPWHLDSYIKLPECASRLNFSTIHEKANINVSHTMKIMLRVERGDDDFLDSKGKRKLWDVIIETPIHILSCRCTQNILPAYTSSSAAGTSRAGSPHVTNGVYDCGFNHATNQVTRGTSTAMSLASHVGRSSSAHSQPIATLEQNLLFARLVAGEENSAGEVPPTYDAVLANAPSAGTVAMERSSSASSGVTQRGRVGRTEDLESEESRGRSSSVVRGTTVARPATRSNSPLFVPPERRYQAVRPKATPWYRTKWLYIWLALLATLIIASVTPAVVVTDSQRKDKDADDESATIVVGGKTTVVNTKTLSVSTQVAYTTLTNGQVAQVTSVITSDIPVITVSLSDVNQVQTQYHTETIDGSVVVLATEIVTATVTAQVTEVVTVFNFDQLFVFIHHDELANALNLHRCSLEHLVHVTQCRCHHSFDFFKRRCLKLHFHYIHRFIFNISHYYTGVSIIIPTSVSPINPTPPPTIQPQTPTSDATSSSEASAQTSSASVPQDTTTPALPTSQRHVGSVLFWLVLCCQCRIGWIQVFVSPFQHSSYQRA
ncbi:arrestin domain protein [Pseudohyphozyma bogoriensis]|nr:arrestin domain protein [Pseudohyphozyma bogoriensis]